MFQNYREALLPWMRTIDNIAYPLKLEGRSPGRGRPPHGESWSPRSTSSSTCGAILRALRRTAADRLDHAGVADAKALVRLLKGIPAKINLIPFNPWPGTAYECSDWAQIEKFSEIIFNAGYASPVRTPRGRDILAACGQLKSATEKLSARERLALRAMAMTD